MDPIIMAYPIYWLAFKLLIAASGPGVGGIKVWEVYNPPDKERLRLANEIFELDTIDFEILFKIKKPESQNTTIPGISGLKGRPPVAIRIVLAVNFFFPIDTVFWSSSFALWS